MGIVSWIILGLIAGFIGSKIVNRTGQGFWLDIVLGIVGALVGGFLFDLFGASGITGLNISDISLSGSQAAGHPVSNVRQPRGCLVRGEGVAVEV